MFSAVKSLITSNYFEMIILQTVSLITIVCTFKICSLSRCKLVGIDPLCVYFQQNVRTLFVSGLPMDTTKRELYLLCRSYEVRLHFMNEIEDSSESINLFRFL